MIENGYTTIGDFAKDANINRDTVAAILKGERRPSTSVMEKFMISLNIEPCNAGLIFFMPDLRNA